METKMTYGKIPYVEKEVSRIFAGTASIYGVKDKNAYFDELFDLGINAFDMARVYFGAEKAVGEWLEKSGKRDEVVLLSKCGHPSIFGKKRVNKKEVLKDFELSTKELHTDKIDIYLLHRDDTSKPVDEVVEMLNELHSKGRIGAFGGSNWTHQRIEEANEYAYKKGLVPFSVSSPNFTLAESVCDPWGGGCVSLTSKESDGGIEWYQKTDMPVIAYSSLAGGLFSGKINEDRSNIKEVLSKPSIKGFVSDENLERLKRVEKLAKEKNVAVPQIAMAYVNCFPMNTFAVVSTRNPSSMRKNIDALNIVLSQEELKYLNLED